MTIQKVIHIFVWINSPLSYRHVDNYLQINDFLYVPGMDTHTSWENTLHKLTFNIDYLDPHRVRVIVSYLGHELGVLYFEQAKRKFINKPVGMGGWLCVDAKVEGLYEYGGENITPKDIISHIQNLLKVGE